MKFYMMDVNFSQIAKPNQRNRMIADMLWVIHGAISSAEAKIAADFPTMTKVTSPRPKGRGFMLHRLQPLDMVLRSYAASTCRDDRSAVFNLIPQFTTG